jgi:hypothetical protein
MSDTLNGANTTESSEIGIGYVPAVSEFIDEFIGLIVRRLTEYAHLI